MKRIIFISLVFVSLIKNSQAQSLELEVLKDVPYSKLSGATVISPDKAWKDVEFDEASLGFAFKSVSTAELNFFHIDTYGLNLFTGADDFTDFFTLRPLGGYFIDKNFNTLLTDEENNLKPALSRISYEIDGLPGNRILKVEYNNVRYYYSSDQDSVNLQIWVFENDGTIEIHFGNIFIANPEIVFPNGPVVILTEEAEEDEADFVFVYQLEGDYQNPVLIEDQTKQHYLTGIPTAGMVYRFKYSSTSVSERKKFSLANFFPNPNTTGIYKVMSADKPGRLIVTDLYGKVILNTAFSGEINISEAPAGVYLYYLQTNGEIFSGKLIKE